MTVVLAHGGPPVIAVGEHGVSIVVVFVAAFLVLRDDRRPTLSGGAS